MKVISIISNIIFYIILAIAAVGIILRLSGFGLYSVVTPSMTPAYPVGSLIITSPVEFDALKEGDVITFALSGNTIVTHRVYSVDESKKTLITKGDANDTPDRFELSGKDIIGKVVFSVPYIGFLSILLTTSRGIILLVGIAVAMLCIFAAYKLFLKSREAHDSESKENTKLSVDENEKLQEDSKTPKK